MTDKESGFKRVQRKSYKGVLMKGCTANAGSWQCVEVARRHLTKLLKGQPILDCLSQDLPGEEDFFNTKIGDKGQLESENDLQLYINSTNKTNTENRCSVSTPNQHKVEERTFLCNRCDSTFRSEEYLESHMKLHETNRTFPCNVCGKEFISQCKLTEHSELCARKKSFSSTITNQTHDKNKFLSARMLDHTEGRRLPVTDFGVLSKIGDQRGEQKSTNYFQLRSTCDICGMVFEEKSHNQGHTKLHKNLVESIKSVRCEVCYKDLCAKQSLEKHSKQRVDEKCLSCKICFETFVSETDLTSHMKIHTDDENSFLCEKCGKKFGERTVLSTHIKIHDNTKTYYRCQICGESFHFESCLRMHLMRSHFNTPTMDSHFLVRSAKKNM